MIKFILTLSLAFLSLVVQAQTANPQNDTIRWNATRFTDLNSNQSIEKSIQFVTNGKNNISWIQKKGNLIYTITIESVADETWIDATTDGSINYNVSFNQMSGTLAITRSSGTITIVLKLMSASDKFSTRYDIANFDIL